MRSPLGVFQLIELLRPISPYFQHFFRVSRRLTMSDKTYRMTNNLQADEAAIIVRQNSLGAVSAFTTRMTVCDSSIPGDEKKLDNIT